MRRIKSLMPIILLSVLLVAGMASAATLTPTGITPCESQSKIKIELSVNDVTGIDAFDITVTPSSGLTITKSDVSLTGSIAASWTVFLKDSTDAPSIPVGSIRIIAFTTTGGGTTGAGKLATVTGTATDGTVNTEIVSVTVTSVTTGIILTPVAMTPVDCFIPTGCSVWDNVVTKYNAYMGPETATWAEVMACYTAYVGTR
jgi:hypothetical protein